MAQCMSVWTYKKLISAQGNSELVHTTRVHIHSYRPVPLHEHENPVKLRILSSNGRHVGVQRSISLVPRPLGTRLKGLCTVALASANALASAFTPWLYLGSSQLSDILKHAMEGPTYCNCKKIANLMSALLSCKHGLCTFSP